jgi:hypothetical protein
MPEKSPAEKMRLKSGMTASLLHVPAQLDGALGMPDGTTLVAAPEGADFILDFATTQAEAEERLLALKPAIAEKTLAWLAYPKGSKAVGYDISRDTVWEFAQTVGLTAVANIAIDEKWSALRIRPVAK